MVFQINWNYVLVGLTYFVLNLVLFFFVRRRQAARRASLIKLKKS